MSRATELDLVPCVVEWTGENPNGAFALDEGYGSPQVTIAAGGDLRTRQRLRQSLPQESIF
ncbi:MAG: hypothetical protein ONB44_17920 [candidate division KSB1 bacterium]|nr:hypothetical protein [candidate division KSB1 bacterium]MDZ7304005.1 hypothetical protein [candidate division KSB1 bacterium]MDZ7313285.1 hypothetical protein [candidate division KSB1 bacterium]